MAAPVVSSPDALEPMAASLGMAKSNSATSGSDSEASSSQRAITSFAAPPSGELRYRGHRENSFYSQDVDELTELRARRAATPRTHQVARLTVSPNAPERTFGGAYQRTALGMAVYAIVVLKIFSSSFAKSTFQPLITKQHSDKVI